MTEEARARGAEERATGPTGGSGRHRRSVPPPRFGDPVGLVLAAVFAVLATLVSWAGWRRLEVPSWDLGIFTQLAKAYAGFGAPIVPIKGEGFNLLGDHFHPILVVLGPIYALFPSAFTLLVVQNLLFAVSVAVVTSVGSERLGRVPGRLIGVAYTLAWGLQSAVAAQFHEIAFAVPLLAIALGSLVRERWRTALIAGGLLVFVKEDLGATTMLLGLVMAWRARRRGERFTLAGLDLRGLGLAVWGIVWLVLATVVILPALNPAGQFDYADQLDIGGLLRDPVQAFVLLFYPWDKSVTLVFLALTGALVWLRSPIALLVVPTLLWRFWSNLEFYWTTDWHYSAVLMPIVFIALIDALDPLRARRRAGDDRQRAGAERGAGDGERQPLSWRRRLTTGVAAMGALVVALMILPQRPFADLVEPATYAPSPRTAAAEEVIGSIPEGSTVLTDLGLMAALVPTTTVYWVGSPGNPATDYVLVDLQNGAWGGSPPADAATYAEELYPGTDYTTVLSVGDYLLARRE